MLDKRGLCLCHVCKDLRRQLSACQQSIEISSDLCLFEGVQRQKRQHKSAVSEICFPDRGRVYLSIIQRPAGT